MQILKSLSFAALVIGAFFPLTPLHCRKGEYTGISEIIEENKGPWFTGPLLAPSGHVVPVGYMNLEPYVFVSDTFGEYNKHWHAESEPTIIGVNPLVFLQIGLTDWMDIQIAPQLIYNHSQGRSSTHFGDLPIGFDIQLLEDKPDNWYPAIKLTLRESFPTGKYQHLNPNKHGTDESGSGSYITNIGLVIARLFHLGGIYYFNARLSNFYNIAAPVHIKGFNAYGGGFGTSGKAHPGQSLNTIIGLEITLAQHWAFALDIANLYSGKTTFSGNKGRTAAGTPAIVGDPSSDQVSLAPAIEYNFNSSVGIIAGAWFSVAGKNSAEFATGVIAINWYTGIKPKSSKFPH